MDWKPTGIDENAFLRYVEEQIYALPGVDKPEEAFTILLTGSRATGTDGPASDVDIDVLCRRATYEALHRACLDAGIINANKSFFLVVPEEHWERYFGGEKGRPHFSVTSLDHVERQFREYEDVWMWVWTNARIVRDPERQFERIVGAFQGYPPDILVRKLKYRWLLAGYWAVELFPHHHTTSNEGLLAASAALLSAVHEYLRLFLLADGRCFPYAERLPQVAADTELGRQYLPMMQRTVDLVVGPAGADMTVWERLDEAAGGLIDGDRESVDAFERTCGEKMIQAGVEPEWMAADFRNIDELLLGELGPVPQIC